MHRRVLYANALLETRCDITDRVLLFLLFFVVFARVYVLGTTGALNNSLSLTTFRASCCIHPRDASLLTACPSRAHLARAPHLALAWIPASLAANIDRTAQECVRTIEEAEETETLESI